MVFNSPEFAIFFPVVFILYWFIFNRSARIQNLLLLAASIFFYAWADWRFLFLVMASAGFNFFIGIRIKETANESRKQQFLWLGILINLGVLGYFKYFNFFYNNFADLLNFFGLAVNHSSLRIILPLGISFFTFQTLGYIIDIYNEEVEPYHDLLNFTTYVLYFPKILAGPIERAHRFIPQIEKQRFFDRSLSIEGLRQILWGLFAKIAIADTCAVIVNDIFDNYQNQNGSMLLLGALCYLIQIYCDFSGYSNIAIGISKLLGIQLMTNFAMPFYSTNVSDFWKKWHISLTSWLMDYVFTPLSFILRKQKKRGLFFAIFITFILVGFWHGANWTFIVFGILQGLYFLPMIIRGNMNRSSVMASNKLFPTFKEFLQMSFMFVLMSLTAVFFRAESLTQAFHYLSGIFSTSLFTKPDLNQIMVVLPFIVIFFALEWVSRAYSQPFNDTRIPPFARWSLYTLIGFIVLLAYDTTPNDFIYLQF
jgi:D-alanyl-lipoteichoic acid acyltransferase DltB (MBOAT superfamily)